MASDVKYLDLEGLIAAALAGVYKAQRADAPAVRAPIVPIVVSVCGCGFPARPDAGGIGLSVPDHRIIMEAVVRHGPTVVDAMRRDGLKVGEQSARLVLRELLRTGVDAQTAAAVERFLCSSLPQPLTAAGLPAELRAKLDTVMGRLGQADTAEQAAEYLDALRHEIAAGDVGMVVGMATGAAILRDGAATIYDADYLDRAGLGHSTAGAVHPALMKKVLYSDAEGALMGGILGLMTPIPGGAESGALSGAIGASVLRVISMF